MPFVPGSLTRRLTLCFWPASARWAFAALTPPVAAAADTLKVGANVGNLPWEFQDATGDLGRL